ncbi:MAG: hypothetical protein JJ976_16520 [Rhodothermales bacterium]|nr:hypothetical protein [Rhodothermales bacterium]
MLHVVHRPMELTNSPVPDPDQGFLTSPHYLRAKDRCLKMMDRLDETGLFGRLDREVQFNVLAINLSSWIRSQSPEALVMAEAPHSHAQYLAYEICRYLEIPVYRFHTWTPIPVLFLQEMNSGLIYRPQSRGPEDVFSRLSDELEVFLSRILGSQGALDFEPEYMRRQRRQSRLVSRILRALRSAPRRVASETYHHWKAKGAYNPLNPARFGLLGRAALKRKRRANLSRACKSSKTRAPIPERFVLFALHYEPERTTNPDGMNFHDQLVALACLREAVPASVAILVKEHPSQLFGTNKGVRGRSPLFYRAINAMDNVFFLGSEGDMRRLITESELVATITGNVAVETALLGRKALVFGHTWFHGCPNVSHWSDLTSYLSLMEAVAEPPERVAAFFRSRLKEICIPGHQNRSTQQRFANFGDEHFDEVQTTVIGDLMENVLTRGLSAQERWVEGVPAE